MNNFLKTGKMLHNRDLPKLIVIGNESCDLDSVVCSISLAFHISKSPASLKIKQNYDHVLPVLNVTRENLPLKTEVVYYLRENDIDLNDLVCKDEIYLPETSSNTNFVLVDHHLSKYRVNVIGVVDHRPFDPNSALNHDIFIYIEEVGSCATLIASLIEKSSILESNLEEYHIVLKLLYGAIVLDTVNLSKQADKTRKLDLEMLQLIEDYLHVTDTHRQELFNSLVFNRNDISSLNTLEVLSKDLKILTRNGRTIAIPGFPLLVQDYILRDNAETAVFEFANRVAANVLILMGMKINSSNTDVSRDIGLINIDDVDLYTKMKNRIMSTEARSFGFEIIPDVDFNQDNVLLS
ncbi:exopolyphosphatase PRUNE1 isoform X2 [Toxorhynchites rutilus septentrionalis]|uniref:exopolyphosphatase PRUNE1 isoform X2 n=1 Tax=Toxorhynchites rutilus septentrionalis TaxID=329112 RepID=UPI0024798916|nr:exopolyphosphatase PRUNE1 isoform X2 [Toxorhynchites rutilus septentrionalis]